MNNLCKMPFLHKYLNVIDNSEKPCCIFQGKQSLSEVKKSFLNNEKPEGCSECWRREKNNILSKRQYFNSRFENHDLNSGIKTFDLRLGTTCNLKCVMCGPHLSSKWQEDIDIFKKYINTKIDNPKQELIDLNFNDCLEIYFAGGEPFYMNEVYTCLKKMSFNQFNLQNTKIRINTNAIINKNNKILKILRKFNKIEITVSVEGYDKVNEYIRYPSKWNEFLEGVNLLYNMSDKPKTMNEIYNCDKSFAFNITVSSLNLLKVFELFNWCDRNNYVYVANFVEEPKLLNINSLHPKIIDKFHKKHEEFKYRFNHLNDIAQYVNDNYKYDENLNKQMESYLLALDIKRNTDRNILYE